MRMLRRFEMVWRGWRKPLLSSGFRMNGGGFMYGASPYQYWIVGPIMVKRYM